MTEVWRPPLAVPETLKLNDLLAVMREEATPLAIVVDEHGGTAGLVTEEDVVEELVGEIADDFDPVPEPRVTRERGATVLSARLTLDEVRDAVGLDLPEGPYETLAGFVVARHGRLPGPTATVEYEGWRIEVLAVDQRRVERVRVVAPPEGER